MRIVDLGPADEQRIHQVATMVVATWLLDPRWKVEIEAEAILD
jgi:hypothetical protein